MSNFTDSHSITSHTPSSSAPFVDFLASQPDANSSIRVGIIGGGTAGSTIAIRLAALGIETYLFERKVSLIDGPPMCHLHAGGNLYREIPDSDCIMLLKQSIEMVRLYPYSMDVRPTVIAVPQRDAGEPKDLLPRLRLLTETYRQIITIDPDDRVLGDPEDYYQLYSKDDLMRLAKLPQVCKPKTTDEWMIGAAKHLDLSKLKFPVIAVKEYGWNIFRLSTSAQAALAEHTNAHLLTNTLVSEVTPIYSTDLDNTSTNNQTRMQNQTKKTVKKWQITYLNNHFDSSLEEQITVDYLINACGFRTGVIDDMIGIKADRMVEFKASYVTHWERSGGQLPEIIIHGRRGTPHGMVQLTPYPDGYFQIHGMTRDITLFDDGLVTPPKDSAQPPLNTKYIKFIDKGWSPKVLHERSQNAINYVSEFLPQFASATPTGNALYGGQQIPGEDDTLRVADVSLYHDLRYARAENVKASSTLQAADEIVEELQSLGLIKINQTQQRIRTQHRWQYLAHVDSQKIDKNAKKLAKSRQFPKAMAKVNNAIKLD